MTIAIGDEAPDFELKDQQNNAVKLSSFRGDKAVALVFYPFTFSGICEGELCALRDDFDDYEKAGLQVVAVSCDSRHAQRAWSEQKGYQFPVLADNWPHGAVAKTYGVFNDALGCANRATFVIDKDGKVVDTFASGDIGTPREKSSYEAAVGKL